ncbi:hypothetical protein C8T65DRAFT_582149 [Cerioporus squamosus]|nr:hypothetical protein C8T65DRAFT_582149 [Cerioporus squamosus]
MANPSRWSLTRLLSSDAQQRARANPNSSTSAPAQTQNHPRARPTQPHRTSQTPQTTQTLESHHSAQSQTQISPQQTRSSQNHQASPAQRSSRSNGSISSSASSARVRAQEHRSRRDQPTEFSKMSSPAVPDSLFFAEDFMLGSGMVIIQPSTGKIVLLHEAEQDAQGRTHHRWFLPKGRKDVGETLEQTALREAYEESGYHTEFLPVIMQHNAPAPLTSLDHYRLRPVTEPIFVSMLEYGNHQGGRNRRGGEYLTFWYIGQVAEDAVPDHDTRMPDEENYETYFLDPDQALKCLHPHSSYHHIVKTAYELWRSTVQLQAEPDYARYMADIEMQEQRLAAEHLEGVVEGDEPAEDDGAWEDTDSPAAATAGPPRSPSMSGE